MRVNCFAIHACSGRNMNDDWQHRKNSDGDESLRKQLSSAQRTVSRLIDAYADGVLRREEFDSRIERARKRQSDLETKQNAMQSQTREQAALREALECLDNFATTIHNNLDQADWTTRREILRTLIDRVVIEPNQIRIVYRINFPLFVKTRKNEKVLHFCWWSGGATLRSSFCSPLQYSIDHHAGTEIVSNQAKQSIVLHLPSHARHEDIMLHAIEKFGKIDVSRVAKATTDDTADLPGSSVPGSFRSKSEARF